MDDLMASAPTVDQAKETRRQLTESGDKAGFHILQWVSNEPYLIGGIKEEDKEVIDAKVWLDSRTWNYLLPKHQRQKWIKRFQELNDLELVKLPRCLKEPVAKAVKLSINTFTDAFENAYTAAVCSCHVYQNGDVAFRLITARSMLAPLKAVSTP